MLGVWVCVSVCACMLRLRFVPSPCLLMHEAEAAIRAMVTFPADDRLSEFRFILLTSSRVPNADMLTRMCPIRVRLQGAA